ncbi:hypothetical protein B0H10DRAFT_1797920, partial [Mycena sp. CBHHK59/15]
ETIFEAIRHKQREEGQAPWAPFESEANWDPARWLSKMGVSQGDINKFLELEKVRRARLSYHNTRAFLQKMDALPTGPAWQCEMFEIRGEKDVHRKFKTEEVEFWKRNPVECIRELMGNAAFCDKMR